MPPVLVFLLAVALAGCGSAGRVTGFELVEDAGADAAVADASADAPVADVAEDAPVVCAADDECVDELFCNGDELCSPDDPGADDFGCVPGTAPCADSQTCSGAMAACLSDCDLDPDADNDGFDSVLCGGLDCDDAVASRYPDATERCDGADDDCDGSVDEDTGGGGCDSGEPGACAAGTEVCSAGAVVCTPNSDVTAEMCNGIDDDCDGVPDNGTGGADCTTGLEGVCMAGIEACEASGNLVCEPITSPSAELCNDLDDDCNGVVDNGLACRIGASEACMASCGTGGNRTCDDATCAWNTCVPPAEECNGMDDDCDGQADNGFACSPGTDEVCDPGCGSTGRRSCTASCTWDVCVAPAESCNGLDDDCDGTPDNGFACAEGTTEACDTSCSSTGQRTCNSSCAWDACEPPVETCNGLDDDCDLVVDNGFTCSPGDMRGCTTSCGSAGTETCDGSCAFGACEPPAEVCNGRDDDCDLVVDNGFACALNQTRTCGTSCGSTGTERCNAACDGWEACVPPVEMCNGVDDDCDGSIDETVECSPGDSQSCTTTCGSTGVQDCSATCSYGACQPPVEICNGDDDDCDGVIDNGFTCIPGVSRSCTTSCNTTGVETCDSTCDYGACQPPAEVCNGADDDCDGVEDNGFTCSPGDMQACTTTCGSTGVETCGAGCSYGACQPPSEVCNGDDDDCDGTPDDGFECVLGATDTCTTTCGSMGARSCDATCSWECTPPAETCNGLDDDCDGDADNGFDCSPGEMVSCTTTCNTTGTQVCDGTCSYGACQPPAEECNGADDDCDGNIDETFTCAPGDMQSCTASCGTTGAQTCTPSCGWGACNPPAEVCNGDDDDCDMIVDDGFACSPGQMSTCTTTCGSQGDRSCSGTCTWNMCNPPAEICNGADDDCDGNPDNGFDCALGASRSCTTGCMTTGTQTCVGCTWDSCAPPPEICNAIDDNCDGVVDEGCAPCTTTDVDFDGVTECDGDCDDTDGSVYPGRAEICDSVDQNCNSIVDEGFDGDMDGFSTCTVDPLLLDCNDANSAVNPGALEDCGASGNGNGVDENCNGLVDETCGACDGSDDDGDGFSECDGDCDDTLSSVFPGAAEVCDGVDNDCNLLTIQNCDVGQRCDFPITTDTCRADQLCVDCNLIGPACPGDRICVSFCEGSFTGEPGAGCTANQTCPQSVILTPSANLAPCLPASSSLGSLLGGESCTGDSQCRSGECSNLGPVIAGFCQDTCDHQGSPSEGGCGGGRLCTILDLGGNYKSICYPSLGGVDLGEACGTCRYGGPACVDGVCARPCGLNDHCPSGYHCSFLGNDNVVGTHGTDAPPAVWGDPASSTVPVCLANGAGSHNRQAGAACASNGDCVSEFCDSLAQVCVDICTSDSTCPAGLTCEPEIVATRNASTLATICVSTRRNGEWAPM